MNNTVRRPGNPWGMEFDYERWFHSVDRNNDSLVSFKELGDEFRRYNPDGISMIQRFASFFFILKSFIFSQNLFLKNVEERPPPIVFWLGSYP